MYLALSLTAVLVSACGTKAPIKAKPTTDKGCLAFDIQKLGEYSTMVARLEVIDAQSGEVLWEASPLPGKVARVAQIEFCEGSNARAPHLIGDKDSLQYTVKDGGDSFSLAKGREYLLKVTSPEHRRVGTEAFTFSAQREGASAAQTSADTEGTGAENSD